MHPLEATSTTMTSEGFRSNQRLSPDDAKELVLIKDLLWGANFNYNVFLCWSQKFEFSRIEPSALVQQFGGELTTFLS